MKRTSTSIGLTLIAATAVASADTFLIDDFADGDAVGWDQNDFTGIGIFDASSGRYVIRSAGAIAVSDPSVGTIESHWLPSLNVPLFGNGRIRGTVRANTYGTTAGFMLRDNENTETDYGFYGSTSFGTFYIERFQLDADPPQTIIAMADPAEAPFVAGVSYHLEGSVVGDRLRLKAWPVGAPEPTEPTLSVTDDALKTTVGNRLSAVIFFDPEPLMAAGVDEVTVSAAFDNVYFTPAGRR
jgi:hypothetical protein